MAQPQPLEIRAKINPLDYVRIPDTKIVIAREESNKGLNWKDTHYALGEDGLFMPSPAIFMPYFKAVVKAHSERRNLYDGSGNSITQEEVEDLYKHLTTNYRGGCWTWLDAKFVRDTSSHNKLNLETDYRYTKTEEVEGDIIVKTITRKSRIIPLEICSMENVYANLEFNSQGLPKTKSPTQRYMQGENIHFWHPRENSVAWFRADSFRADLSCYGDPLDSDSALGVFSCAEGIVKE